MPTMIGLTFTPFAFVGIIIAITVVLLGEEQRVVGMASVAIRS